MEEALLQMGILDALVVDVSYREQVLTLSEGCEDRYLFVQKSHSGKSLLDVLELNDSMNDIFSNQRLTGILSNIAYDEDGVISVSPEGIYQMGVLCGTITGEHVAGFLGTRARERNRQEHICRVQCNSWKTRRMCLKTGCRSWKWNTRLCRRIQICVRPGRCLCRSSTDMK